MEANNIFRQKKSAIARRWFTLTLDGYPAGAGAFFGKEADSFANPVGSTLQHGMKVLFDYLVDETESAKLSEASEALENIVKIRAVQDFSPSEALSFVFLLKKAVRLELKDDIRKALVSPDELSALDSRIDELGLLSFDVYMKCREKIYELRTNQTKNMMFTLFKRADMPHEIPVGRSDAGKNMSNGAETR